MEHPGFLMNTGRPDPLQPPKKYTKILKLGLPEKTTTSEGKGSNKPESLVQGGKKTKNLEKNNSSQPQEGKSIREGE